MNVTDFCSRYWPRLCAAFLLAALAVVATFPAWADIADRAINSPEDSHILLALPVAAWLAWLRRSRLRRWMPVSSLLGPAMIVIGWLLTWMGDVYLIDIAAHFGALIAVLGAVVSVVGITPLLRLKAAVACLVFLFPFPGRFRQDVAIPLQHASAVITEHTLQFFGVDVVRAGIVLELQGQQVAVAEACNGMRMVTSLALIAFAFAFSVPMRRGVRIAMLALSPLVALAVNVARLIPTTLMYGYAGAESADAFHDLSGWLAIGLAVAMLWAGLGLLRWLEIPLDPMPVNRVTT